MRGEKKQKESSKYSTKKEALEAEREFLNNTSLLIPDSNITFKELINEYINYQTDRIKITSLNVIKKKVKYLSSLENIKLKDYNIKHFELWKKEINDKNISTIYKNNLYKCLRSILRFAIQYYDISSLNNTLSKMSNFTNPNELKKEMLFYTYEEFERFIEQEDDLKYKTFFKLLYFCGLRKGEANALTWKRIDFDMKTISIQDNIALKIKGYKYIILPPKTKGSNRILPIPKTLENDLKELKKQYSSYVNFSEDWFVFGGIFPLADTSISNRNKENAKNANIKQIRIHDFRHSCASLLINNGASITLVAKYLGHSNIATTLNTYSHMFKNQFNEIVEQLDKLTGYKNTYNNNSYNYETYINDMVHQLLIEGHSVKSIIDKLENIKN